MNVGQKYRVIWSPAGTLHNKEAVMKFLAETDDAYLFDLRPLAGTQTLPKRNAMAIYEVHEDVELMLPRPYHAEVRIL